MENPKFITINNFSNVNFTNSSIKAIEISNPSRVSALVIVNYNQDSNVNFKNCYIDIQNILTTNEYNNNDINLTFDNCIFSYDYNKIIDTNWTYNGDIYPASYEPVNTYIHCNITSITNVDNIDTLSTDTLFYDDTNFLSEYFYSTSAIDEFKNMFYYNYESTSKILQGRGNYNNYFTSVRGDINLPTSANDFYDGLRDGVGCFYFPYPDLEVSATETSGTTPFTVTAFIDANIPNVYCSEMNSFDEDTSACTKKYTFDFEEDSKSILYSISGDDVYGFSVDGIDTSAIDTTIVSGGDSTISADYIYNDPGVYTIQVSTNSLNGWNVYEGNEFEVSAYASSLSADFIVYDKSTGNEITSATTYQDIQVKVYNFVGGITEFDLNFNDTSASSIPVTGDEVYVDYYYLTSSTGPIELTLYNNMDQTSAVSASFTVEEYTQNSYYVNINPNYDSNTNNLGTITDPFNYSEFIELITSGGDFNDIFYLQGLREIGTNENKALLEINSDKSFIIDVWDAKYYGPWVLIINDYQTTRSNNSNISFKGSHLKNGIIYNKLNGVGGGVLEISYVTNMYIVWQGYDSRLKITQDEYNKIYDNCKINACTIFSENGNIISKIDKPILSYTFS